MQNLQMVDDDDEENIRSVSDLIQEKRLLIIDYKALAGVTKPAKDGFYRSSEKNSRNIFYAPIVLLYR